jgi:hypothetical protein
MVDCPQISEDTRSFVNHIQCKQPISSGAIKVELMVEVSSIRNRSSRQAQKKAGHYRI